MKSTKALANALAVIAASSSQIESKADAILAIIKDGGIRDEKSFQAAIKLAYAANGWHTAAGRPRSGVEKKKLVPATVKQYVSRVRAALRAKLPLAKFKTFHELRKALKNVKAKDSPIAANDPIYRGLHIVRPEVLLGAPFHDIAVIHAQLGKVRQAALLDDIAKLIKRYSPLPELKIAA